MTQSTPLGSSRRLLPPVLFLAALLLQLGLHFLLPVTRLVPPPWNLLGLALILGGLTITIVADQQFKRASTPVHPFASPTSLVTDGVVAVILGSLTPLLVPPLYAWIIWVQFIRIEEVTLLLRFGQAYSSYAARVRRWL